MCASRINWFSRRLREAVSCLGQPDPRSVFSPRPRCRPHGQPPTLPEASSRKPQPWVGKGAATLGQGKRGLCPHGRQTRHPFGCPEHQATKMSSKEQFRGIPVQRQRRLTTLPPLRLHRSQRGEGNPSRHLTSILKPPPARQNALQRALPPHPSCPPRIRPGQADAPLRSGRARPPASWEPP